MLMRGSAAALVAVALCARPTPLEAQRQIQFFVQFTDAAGRPVSGVEASEVQVEEDGAAGKVLTMEPIDWPVRVAILVDNGTGSAERLVPTRNGVKGLIEALPEGVEASLQTTAPQPRWLVRPTKDRAMLLAGVDRITPDSAAGRFVDGLTETANRFDKERGESFPVIVILGSLTAEGSQIRDNDITKLFKQTAERAPTVHVVMVGSSTSGLTAAANQTQIGIQIAKQSGGRYESIAAPTRLGTLLPEIGAQVAQSHARQSQQYRITFERPNGKAGALGSVGISVAKGLTVKATLDGHLP